MQRLLRRRRQEDLWTAYAKGAASGFVGTIVITLGMRLGPTLMGRLSGGQPQAAAARGQEEEPTEKLAERVAGEVLETRLEPETKQTAGQAIHWGYGTFWGGVYGMAESRLRWSPLASGALFGTLLATIASTLVPGMRLSPPPTEQPMSRNAMMFVLHLLYGWATAFTFQALTARR